MANRTESRSRSRQSFHSAREHSQGTDNEVANLREEIRGLREQISTTLTQVDRLTATSLENSNAAMAANQVIRNLYHILEQQQIRHREHGSILDRRRAMVTQSLFALATMLRENGFINHEQWQHIVDFLVPPSIIQVELF